MKKSPSRSPYPIRTRLARDIVADVMIPTRQSGTVFLLCPGVPSSPTKNDVLRFLSDAGSTAILMRYRGTWESGGIFLRRSPAEDVRDVVEELVRTKTIIDLARETTHRIRVNNLVVVGSSFGGSAALLSSSLRSVDAVIALAPVIDWNKEGEGESFVEWTKFVRRGFGGAFRPDRESAWRRLREKNFSYSPLHAKEKIRGRKVLLFHCTDDPVVPVEPTRIFVGGTNITYIEKRKGGHLGLGVLAHQYYFKKILAFLRSHRRSRKK